MTPESDTDRAPLVAGRWPWRLAVAFVILTLLSLAVVPWLVQLRVNALRERIDYERPARTLVMQWQFALVHEMGALNELLLTGDTAELARLGGALAWEQSLYEEGMKLANELGPEVLEAFVRARTLAERWHLRARTREVAESWESGTRLMDLPRERELFESTLAATAAVDSAIVRATDARRTQIREAERTGLRLTALLAVLALFASGAVIALELRILRFAAEAERRRALADAALAESARADEARTRLLRGITHDVKNPLGAASGYADLLSEGVKAPLADAQKPLVEGIRRSIDSALEIIADLLDLAHVGTELSIERREVDLNAVAQEAVRDHVAHARATGHEIDVDIGSGPLPSFTDPARVRQVLGNLITNAIKYTPAPGRITVRTRARADGGPGPGIWSAIEVADTGPGIPPDKREAVFEEFTRLGEDADSKGHGLGLAIARSIARRLGGDVTIADATVGATFVLWIPQREG